MTFNELWYIGIMIISGLVFGRLAKLIKLPNVTGYLIAGLIIGPQVLKLLPLGIVTEFELISDVALGFIAFSIGSEFKLSYIKRVGIAPIVIACLEALLASVCVICGLLAAGADLAFALVLGAIASATAPAATIMVIRQYKAKGPLSETLLTVVALDDAAALMLFGILSAISAQLVSGSGGNMLAAIIKPIFEIVCSLLLGGVLGVLFTIPLRFFKKDGNRLCITIAFVFIAAALSVALGLSSLLVCMALGAVLVNVSSQANHIMKITDSFTPPILMLFFVLSGSELNLSILPTVGLFGIIYVLARVAGKCIGAFAGAKLMKMPPAVAKYLGLALVPQAGVAIGLSLLATSIVPQYGSTIRAIVLCGTFIYEIIGPVLAKFSLHKAGEITG